MYRLTERRFTAAQPILEKYRDVLQRSRRFDASAFEHELRKCWDVGYQELKSIVRDLSKREGFVGVAAYYMENSNIPGVVSEFKLALAKLYGIRSYHAPDRDEARNRFWERVFGENRK